MDSQPFGFTRSIHTYCRVASDARSNNRKRIRLLSSRDRQELSPLDAHEHDVTTLDITPDGRWMVSGGDDGFVCL